MHHISLGSRRELEELARQVKAPLIINSKFRITEGALSELSEQINNERCQRSTQNLVHASNLWN